MGFGVNSARDPNFKNYDLTDETHIRIIPFTENENMISTYKSEYERWIIANGFREIIEIFSIFLEEIHTACLTLAWNTGKYTSAECDKMRENFRTAGLPNKFMVLEQRFYTISNDKHHILSINKARNCLTHRNGIVGKNDIDDSGELKITWVDIEILIVPKGKSPISSTNIRKGGILTPEGGHIESHNVTRELVFKKGDYLKFTPRQISEICLFVNSAAIQICNSSVEYSRRIGIEVRDRP
jgi:hypothetical protein